MNTTEQEFIINKAVYEYNYGNDNLFQYTGEAGTGKTYVLKQIANRLNLSQSEIMPIAYTGQAACVMRTKGLYNARTANSALYNYENTIDTSKINTAFNKPKIIRRKILKNLKKMGIKLIMVDEGYMMPYEFRNDILSQGIFTVVTGDPSQLSTIYGKPAFLTSGTIYKLTMPMRQDADRGIYYLANRAKSGLPIHYGNYGDAIVIPETELNDDMIKWANIIICGRNKTREMINNHVRNLLGYNRDIPMINERLICKKNNWDLEVDGISLVNGLIGTVVNMPTVEHYDNITFGIDFRPDLCVNIFDNIRVNYEYFNAPMEKKSNIKESPYLVGECFEYAYSSTVHSAQGSEHYRGIYIEEPWSSDIAKNLNYTGITRFRKQLIYVKRTPKYF